jgi:hypothetical protein
MRLFLPKQSDGDVLLWVATAVCHCSAAIDGGFV